MTATESYSRVSRVLHWLTLALLIILFGLGWSFEDYPQPTRGELLGLHKSVGILVLALTILRLVYRWTVGVPALPPGLPAWQNWAARGLQYGLYGLLVLQPLLGWIGTDAAGRPVSVFGAFDLPVLLAPDKELRHQLFAAHGLVATIILALVAIHALAALYHHYIRRDNVLRAMLRGA